MSSDQAIKVFSNPQIVDDSVNTFNHRNPAHPMSGEDRATLKGDARLAEAVFGEGISGLISARATTVAELKGKSPELLQFLSDGLGQGLVKDNVITVDQLSKIPAENLKAASESLKNGESLDAARTLGLNADQTGALVASVRKTQEQFTHDLMPDLQLPSPASASAAV